VSTRVHELVAEFDAHALVDQIQAIRAVDVQFLPRTVLRDAYQQMSACDLVPVFLG
jgi:hypothetical protein